MLLHTTLPFCWITVHIKTPIGTSRTRGTHPQLGVCSSSWGVPQKWGEIGGIRGNSGEFGGQLSLHGTTSLSSSTGRGSF